MDREGGLYGVYVKHPNFFFFGGGGGGGVQISDPWALKIVQT